MARQLYLLLKYFFEDLIFTKPFRSVEDLEEYMHYVYYWKTGVWNLELNQADQNWGTSIWAELVAKETDADFFWPSVFG